MREATARQTIRTMSPSTIQVLLEFGPGVEPIAGILQPSAHGDPKLFTVWLHLTEMLEAIRRCAPGA
jgi:hypothetical protein